MIAFKIYGDFWMERCTKNKNLLVKILKNGICYKIKRFTLFWLKFWHNTHFDSRNTLTKLNFKIFQISTPYEEKFKFSPISSIFGQQFPNRDLPIFVHTWNLLTFKIYIFGIFWQNFMVVGSCVQYLWFFWDGILTEISNFIVKTPKNWIYPKITSLASFAIKFSHNTYITNTNMKKW